MAEPTPPAELDDDTPKTFACPECGEEYGTAMHLGLHRKHKHGVAGQSKTQQKERRRRTTGGGRDRQPSGRGGETRHARRRRAVRETITEFVDFADELRGRPTSQPLALVDVIRRDAERIADSVAWAAERFNPVAIVVDRLAGHGSPVTFARGFIGVGTWLVRKWRGMLADRDKPADLIPVYDQSEDQVAWTDGRGSFYSLEGEPIDPPAAEMNGALVEQDRQADELGGPDLTSHTT